MATPALMESVRDFQNRLSPPVARWRQAVCGWNIEAREFDTLVDALVLPLRRVAPEMLDLGAVVSAAERKLARSPDAPMRGEVQRRLRNVVIELLAAEPDLLRHLSDMAYEAASYRILITSQDRFDVSAAAVLGAVALCNYAHALDCFRQRHGRPPDGAGLLAIYLPLDCAADGRTPLKPGDLWFLDLVARTVCLAEKILPAEAQAVREPAEGPRSPRELIQLAAPRFVAVSLLYKLLGASRLPAWLLQKGQYKLWPGLNLIVADRGAESLRAVVVGELARQVATDRAGFAQAALIRFLSALLQFQEPASHLQACLLIADLFWEMLELDDKVMGRLYAQPKLAPTLHAALAAVEQPLDRFADFPNDRRRLAETRELLQTMDQYRAFVSLAASARSAEPAPAGRAFL